MLIFDIETDGLLDSVTTVHCAVTYDTGTGVYKRYTPTDIQTFLSDLNNVNEICGHNVIGYDLPVLKKLYGFQYGGLVRDTLVWSRLCWSDIKQGDFTLSAKGTLPSKLIGSHSLKAYGYRLGELKGDYGQLENAWDSYCPEMLDYCERDVVVTKLLFEKLCDKQCTEESIVLEHRVAEIIQGQIEHGFLFNIKQAESLYCQLLARREELKAQLLEVFKPWYKKDKEFTPKGNNKKLGYRSGCPLTMISLTEFNPSSRQHIAYHLKQRYDWEPESFTEKGEPKIDETVLSAMEIPEAKLLSEYFLVEKRIGMLGEGNQAWLKQVKKDNRMHGGVITNGAVTGRATHNNPNIAQVPSTNAPYGTECRSLFTIPEGYKLVGADASGLELRCLAHYMGKYDKGAYSKVILEGDIHSVNQEAAGLSTRSQAKTFIYGYLFGAGDEKIGQIVGGSAAQGKKLKAQFLKKTPALKYLKESIDNAVKAKGYLLGLDGRVLPIRSPHAALNTLLQSAGAVIMKKAMVFLDDYIKAEQLPAYQVAWVHDEYQLECLESVAERVGELAVKAIRDAGDYYSFRCPLDGEYKIGSNWAECH